MTTSSPTVVRTSRHLFRFSLRTLLIVVTVAAIGSWVYWSGWPRFWIFWQQTQFENGARRLKVGSVPLTGMQLVSGKNLQSTTYTSDGRGRLIGLTKHVWPNAVYCIYYVFPRGYSGGMMNCPCDSVEVFRLPPVPPGYLARTTAGRERTGQTDGKPGPRRPTRGLPDRFSGRDFRRSAGQPWIAVRANPR